MQLFSRPDAYAGPCGDLRCALVERRVSGAPGFMQGLRLLFLTDIHALDRTTDADFEALAAKLRDARADIILLGGDYADTAGPAARFFEHLRRVSARYGIYAAVGNNDREAFPDIGALRRIASGAGVRLLINERRVIRLGRGRLFVAGLDEYRWGRPDAAGLYPGVAGEECYRILISHYPKPVEPMPDLMLCGHTHGGQFNALGATPYTVGFERLLVRRRAPCWIAGMHSYGGGRVFVGKGIGASRLPLRVGVRPELDLLVFDC